MFNVILTSTGFSNSSIARKVDDFFVGDFLKRRAAIITTAAADKEKNEYAIRAHSQISNMGFGKVEFFDLEKRFAREVLDYDFIYVNGGNTYVLLDWIRKSGFEEAIKDFLQVGGLYMGVSAGSLVAGISIDVLNYVGGDENTVGIDDFSGMGFIDRVIVPHYNDREEAVVVKYEKETGAKAIRLADGMGVVGRAGGKFEMIDGFSKEI